MRLISRVKTLLSDVTGGTRDRDPEVAGAVTVARSHIRTNRQILKEMKAVQVQLERASRH
jgi:hypothetical protein